MDKNQHIIQLLTSVLFNKNELVVKNGYEKNVQQPAFEYSVAEKQKNRFFRFSKESTKYSFKITEILIGLSFV